MQFKEGGHAEEKNKPATSAELIAKLRDFAESKMTINAREVCDLIFCTERTLEDLKILKELAQKGADYQMIHGLPKEDVAEYQKIVNQLTLELDKRKVFDSAGREE